MAGTPKLDSRVMMEKAIIVMKQSINESRADKKASPMVGAVLLKSDGTVETAHRGELREGTPFLDSRLKAVNDYTT